MGSEKKDMAGTHFEMGNWACAEGAIAAGCGFFSGYPITPASEIANRLAQRIPETGGVFLQTEDEISAICAAIGASWTGRKAMTATSGPGISLMQENIGFAMSTETPLVIVDVQRLGPSTGSPAIGLTGDMVQVARGSHGDYQIIALSPESPQEMFDLTIQAFNLAEKYRVPVFLMADAFLGHMREQVIIPRGSQLEVVDRKTLRRGIDPKNAMERHDFLDVDVAPMPLFGNGFGAHVTSSCHDEHGMRNLTDPELMHKYIKNPIRKILKKRDDIVDVKADYSGAEIVIVSYGTVSRSARAAAQLAREEGIKVGTMRLVTCWPLADEEIRQMAESVESVLVVENNTGQMYPYIKAEAAHACRVEFLGPEILGQIHKPEYIVSYIREMIG